MTWFMIDDGIYDAPQCEELHCPRLACGRWPGSYVGRQLRHGDYDGAITMQRVRKLGGSPKLARQLVDAGLWRETEPGVFEIVAAQPRRHHALQVRGHQGIAGETRPRRPCRWQGVRPLETKQKRSKCFSRQRSKREANRQAKTKHPYLYLYPYRYNLPQPLHADARTGAGAHHHGRTRGQDARRPVRDRVERLPTPHRQQNRSRKGVEPRRPRRRRPAAGRPQTAHRSRHRLRQDRGRTQIRAQHEPMAAPRRIHGRPCPASRNPTGTHCPTAPSSTTGGSPATSETTCP